MDTHAPYDSKNSIYIMIQAKDHVVLGGGKTLRSGNNLGLEVCGILHIGEMDIDEMVPSVILSLEGITVNKENLTISATASLFSENEITAAGFYISKIDQEDPVTGAYHVEGVMDVNMNASAFYEGEVSIDGIQHHASEQLFQAGETYQLIAYAENATGIGYSAVWEFDFDSTAPQQTDPPQILSELGDMVVHNRIKLIICDEGSLTIGKIGTKNNALLHIDGKLVVDSILFTQNNYCITGTGSISTPSGDAPPIVGSPSNHCEGFKGILPIDLLSFSSRIDPWQVTLQWSTATEINNDYFTIERSPDMLSWEVVGHVEGAGFSNQLLNYSFSDGFPAEGLIYYRLKQTDFDGRYEYFSPLAVMYMPGMEGLDFRVVRQPGSWHIALPPEEVFRVEVFLMNGRRLYSGAASGMLSIPAPGQAVVIRIFNSLHNSVSRVVL